MLPQATADLRRANQLRYLRLLLAIRAQWARLTPKNDWDAAWAQVAPRVTGLVAAAQYGAAQDGAASVAAALAQTGADAPNATGRVNPAALAGVASDGRPLDTLLAQALVQARMAGGTAEDMLTAGRRWLEIAAHMQTVDAARGASSMAITATRGAGWVRWVSPPCCKNCAVLSGKWFRWNQGFERHPGCDCIHRPAMESEAPANYRQDVDPSQIKDLTVAQRQALAEGADLSRVVNAYRSEIVPARHARMYTTTELGSVGSKVRLTPEGIYARAAGDRERAVELLRQHGYIT